MGSSLALPAIALLGLGLAACGGSNGSAPQHPPDAAARSNVATKAAPQHKDSDDDDNDAGSDDDSLITEYGHTANAADEHAITATVKRYYKAAADSDGARACSMLVSTVAEAIPEETGDTLGQASMRGKSCGMVISKLFARQHRKLVADFKTLDVTRVRIGGGRGWVVMSFATTSQPRKLPIRREAGIWKIKEVLDSGIP